MRRVPSCEGGNEDGSGEINVLFPHEKQELHYFFFFFLVVTLGNFHLQKYVFYILICFYEDINLCKCYSF